MLKVENTALYFIAYNSFIQKITEFLQINWHLLGVTIRRYIGHNFSSQELTFKSEKIFCDLKKAQIDV